MIVLTTLCLNAYIALLSLQLNGIMVTDAIRIPMLIFMVAESVLVLFVGILPQKINGRIHVPGVLACAILFMIVLCCNLFFIRLTFSRIVEFAFFPICLFVTYVNFIEIKKEEIFDRIIDIQFYYLIVVSIAFFVAQVQRRGEFINNINTVYYVIFSLPFILQHKSKNKKIIGLTLILGCLFLSLKRTPLIAVGLVLLFYDKRKNTVLRMIKKGLGLLIALIIIDMFLSRLMDIHILRRLLSLVSDGGSGRTDLAKRTIELLMQSSFSEFLFGHALNSTFSVFALGAHNDFLEVIYRMGVVGFVIFIGYFVGIIAQMLRCGKMEDYQNSNMLQSAFIMFGVVAFSSQLIFLPTYVGLVALSISFAIARNRYLLKQSQND